MILIPRFGVEKWTDQISVKDFLKQLSPGPVSTATIESVWSRLLPAAQIKVHRVRMSKPYTLAILYMLHIERFSSERPRGEDGQPYRIREGRQEALKRFNVWVRCKCREDCDNEWNFVNDRGIHRKRKHGPSALTGECELAQLLDYPPGQTNRVLNFFRLREKELRNYKVRDSMWDDWKKTSVRF